MFGRTHKTITERKQLIDDTRRDYVDFAWKNIDREDITYDQMKN